VGQRDRQGSPQQQRHTAKHELAKHPHALSNGLPQVIRNRIPHPRHSIPLFEPALQLPPTPPFTPTDRDSGGEAAHQSRGEEAIGNEAQLPELGSGFDFDGLVEGSSFHFDRSIDDNTENSLQALADARASPPHPSLPKHDEAPRNLDISASVEHATSYTASEHASRHTSSRTHLQQRLVHWRR
jgi:hypothetical protein